VRLPRAPLRRLPRRLFAHTADYLLEARALVHTFRPDLIHVLYAAPLDALALAGTRVPVVTTPLGSDVLPGVVPRPWPLDRLVRRLLRRSAVVFAKSSFLEARCRALGAERVVRVPWGVDPSVFAPGERASARRSLGLPQGRPLLFSARALWPLYNHLPLLEAAARLPEPPQVLLTRRGADAEHAERVQERARALGIQATLLEGVPLDAMPQLYAAVDAVASLPSSDGLPQTVFEALACGRPTLALDLEAYAEWPFAGDALRRVAHVGGRPCPEAARRWISEHASLAASVEAVARVYRELV
jgi:glycosyltransferase involved in cell wall biosynthesis